MYFKKHCIRQVTFRPRRIRRSILDLIFMPGFLIMEEITDRLRELLNVR